MMKKSEISPVDDESMNMKSIKLGSFRSRRPSNQTEYDLPMGHDIINEMKQSDK